MKEYLLMVALVANIMFGTLLTIFLLVSGWTIFLAPFCFAGMLKLGSYILEEM